jgi:hypothetical protein
MITPATWAPTLPAFSLLRSVKQLLQFHTGSLFKSSKLKFFRKLWFRVFKLKGKSLCLKQTPYLFIVSKRNGRYHWVRHANAGPNNTGLFYMILVVRNWSTPIIERITDTDMKKLENSMKIHNVYLEMFDMCSISYSANVNQIFEFFPRTPQLWLIDFGYGLWN